MKVTETALPGVLLIEPAVFGDDRGFFLETWNAVRYPDAGVAANFVQANQAHSRRGVLRGLHFQMGRPQAKLVLVTCGEIFDVAVDIRRGSPTFGRWVGSTLSGENHRQLFVPAGFAHGYCVLSGSVDVSYLCSEIYWPAGDRGVRWDDPALGIDWPPGEKILSAKDRALPLLADASDLPFYSPPTREGRAG
ncbi:MAG: dTDP-4-dehydrorhamnose 3,5-epimerase [Candidatus Geothermincolia bacterium]